MNFIIIIPIILLIIIIIGPIIVNNNIFTDILKKFPILDNIEYRTGDIILYRWNYSIMTIPKNKSIYLNNQSLSNIFIDNLLISYVYNMEFFHCGIVVIYDNKPYILELTETDTFCNFDNKIAHYVPSLSSMGDFDEYNGAILRIPYNGPTISDNTITNILESKNRYVHAWHPDYGLLKNYKYYLYDMPDFNTCGPIIKKITDSDCPYYVNCVQYVCAILRNMGISYGEYCMKTTTTTLFNYCMNSNNYNSPHLIKNSYLLNYI